jgi:hypothetical protein
MTTIEKEFVNVRNNFSLAQIKIKNDYPIIEFVNLKTRFTRKLYGLDDFNSYIDNVEYNGTYLLQPKDKRAFYQMLEKIDFCILNLKNPDAEMRTLAKDVLFLHKNKFI